MAIFSMPRWWRKREPVTPTSATAPTDLPELTPEEIRNGWTREALARYRLEMDVSFNARAWTLIGRRSNRNPASARIDYPVFGR